MRVVVQSIVRAAGGAPRELVGGFVPRSPRERERVADLERLPRIREHVVVEVAIDEVVDQPGAGVEERRRDTQDLDLGKRRAGEAVRVQPSAAILLGRLDGVDAEELGRARRDVGRSHEVDETARSQPVRVRVVDRRALRTDLAAEPQLSMVAGDRVIGPEHRLDSEQPA